MTIARPALESESKLSASKQAFLRFNRESDGYKLGVSELRKVAKHYQNVHHIEIIINGSTELGRRLVEQNHDKMRTLWRERSQREDMKYAQYYVYIRRT